MKTPYYGVLLLGLCLCPLAMQGQPAAADPLEDPRVVSLGNDEARTPLIPYNTLEGALTDNPAASTYVQWLDGAWKVKPFADAAALDTALTAPGVDPAGWGTAQVPARQRDAGEAAIYRTDFKAPFAWIDREVFVHVGPVSHAYWLFINGKRVGYFGDSRSAAEFNITKYVAEGKNHLAVVAYASPASAVLDAPGSSRGTAIEGDVYVFSQPKVRMRDYVADMRMTPDGSAGLFNLGVVVKSHLLNPKEVTVHYDLYGPDGVKVTSGRRDARFDMRREDTVRFFANIPGIESWSHESPKLYTVALRLQHEGRFTEYTALKVGFREVAYGAQGLTLNGRPLDLRGIDYACPADTAALQRDLAGFKKAGINLLRLDGPPRLGSFYPLCDSYGFYVCVSANLGVPPGGGAQTPALPANDTLWEKAFAGRVLDSYYASRNHPSVILFSLGNRAGQGYNLYEAYRSLKALETGRPVIYEGAGAEWNTDLVVGTPAGRHAGDDRYTLNLDTPARWQGAPAPQGKILLRESDQPETAIVQNDYRLAGLSNFKVGYTVLSGKRVVKEGVIPASAAPGESLPVHASLEGLKPGKYTLHFYVSQKNDLPWAKTGERLAEIDWQVEIAKTPKP